MLISIQRKCDGSALIIALLILIVMTILGISTVTTSTQEMIMAGNTQDASASFQASEAGITGTMSLVGTNNDPFKGANVSDVFDNFEIDDHPLKAVLNENHDGSVSAAELKSLAASTEVIQTNVTCPRKQEGSSVDLISCNNYQITSIHASANTGAYTHIRQGVQKEILAR